MRFNLRTVVWIGFLLGAGLFLGGADGQGCGGKSFFKSMADDGTKEAKLEAARIALDEGKFGDAVDILEELCGADVTSPSCDPEVVSLYASAFAGRAGLDVFDLIQGAADQPATTGESSFAFFARRFAAPSAADVSDMNSAVRLLTSTALSARTPDQGLQLAVATVVDLVVLLGSKTNGYGPDGRPNQIPTVEELNLTVLQGLTLIQRVFRDVNSMNVGLGEANIGDENISGHISRIQERLDIVTDAAAVQDFLSDL